MDDFTDAAARLRAGRTSAVALADESLATIERANAQLNAFTSVHADAARAFARRADDELAAGHDRGLLHGIPISIKDLIDQAGRVTTAAARVLVDRQAEHDAVVVTRLREAGAVIIGRTNLHQFALGTTSEDSAFGAVRHPIDRSRSPGGSSGGSAVAVATGMGLASIGTDTGGSIRIPSAACGIVGLKASAGEIPTEGIIPLSPSLDHAGPMTRSVRDAAALYQVLAGRHPAPIAAANPAGLRLVHLAGYFSSPLEPGVREAFEGGLSQLRRAGVLVRSGEVPSSAGIAAAYIAIVLPEAAAWHAPYIDSRAEGYLPSVRDRILSGRAISSAEIENAHTMRAQLCREVNALLADADALVLPTLPILAPPVGATAITPDPSDGTSLTVRAAMLKHTQLFNLTGHPAISLPIATAGLPVGLQLVGRFNETPRLLEIALACEAALVQAASAIRPR